MIFWCFSTIPQPTTHHRSISIHSACTHHQSACNWEEDGIRCDIARTTLPTKQIHTITMHVTYACEFRMENKIWKLRLLRMICVRRTGTTISLSIFQFYFPLFSWLVQANARHPTVRHMNNIFFALFFFYWKTICQVVGQWPECWWRQWARTHSILLYDFGINHFLSPETAH